MFKDGLAKNRIIAAVLAVVVLFLLFFSWIGVTGRTRKNWDVVKKAIDRYASQIDYYVEIANRQGLDIDTGEVRSIVRSVSNGRLSPFEIFTAAGHARSIVKKLGKIAFFAVISSEMSRIRTYATLYRILFALTFLAVVFSIFIRISGKLQKLDFLMFLFVALLFIVFAVLSAELKGSDIALGMTVFPFLALILSLPQGLINKLPFMKAAGGADTTGDTDLAVSAITAASALKDKASGLLHRVGTRIKGRYQCPVCGAELKGSDKTCPRCRTAVTEKMNTRTCKSCGCRIPSDSRYCEICGAKQDQ